MATFAEMKQQAKLRKGGAVAEGSKTLVVRENKWKQKDPIEYPVASLLIPAVPWILR